MKITIYELLGLVKDGKAPKKIKYENIIYQYDYEDEFYYYKDSEISKMFFDYGFENLNDEVEIIEEEKKIPEKLDNYADVSGDLACAWSFAEKKLKDKINEILDYLKSKGE